MTKRLGFLLVALLIVPMLLTGCDSESPDKAEEYMNAVLAGKVEEAQALACDDESAATTAAAAAAYAGQYPNMVIDPDKVDLKYDMGKGMNDKEVIVTGAIVYAFTLAEGAEASATDIEIEYILSQKDGSIVVLQMDKNGDDWCVSKESTFGILSPEAAEGDAAADDAAAGDAEVTATEEPTTEDATPEVTPEPTKSN